MNVQLISKYRTQIMGFAAVMVLLFHFFPCLYPDLHIPVVTALLKYGNIGVDIFLLLSGMGLYCSLSKDSRTIPFYRKRISRVVIPALLISLPYWICTDFLFKHTAVRMFLLDWSGLSFWTHGNGTVWYVSLIVLLYLVYPAIFRMQQKSPWQIVLLMLAVYAADIVVFLLLPEQFDKLEAALTRIPVFLTGSLFGGMLLGTETEQRRIQPVLRVYTVLMLVIFVTAFVTRGANDAAATLLYRFGSGSVAVLLSLLTAWLLERFGPARLDRVLKSLGAVSLELYLIHIFIKNILTVTHIGTKSGFAVQLLVIAAGITVSLLLTFGVAYLEHRIRDGSVARKKADKL